MAGANENAVAAVENSFVVPQKVTQQITSDPPMPFLGVDPEVKAGTRTDAWPAMCTAAKRWEHQCPPVDEGPTGWSTQAMKQPHTEGNAGTCYDVGKP